MGLKRYILAMAAAAAAVLLAPAQAGAKALPVASPVAVEAGSLALVGARGVLKRTKNVRRHGARARTAYHRKHRSMRSAQRKRAVIQFASRTSRPRACRKRRACRRERDLDAPYRPDILPAPLIIPDAPIQSDGVILGRKAPVAADGGDPSDIVERETDIALIVDVARSLKGYRVEHALTIIETRDAETGALTYRVVQGDESKRTPDSAELPELNLAPGERIVADVHSHPMIKPAGRSLKEMSSARRATQANFYPGVEDYAAVERRGAVSAILDPEGGVMLLRRVAGAPSVRKVFGDALEPLTETAASGLDLDFLYAQGYLAQGDWARPAVAETLHAGR